MPVFGSLYCCKEGDHCKLGISRNGAGAVISGWLVPSVVRPAGAAVEYLGVNPCVLDSVFTNSGSAPLLTGMLSKDCFM